MNCKYNITIKKDGGDINLSLPFNRTHKYISDINEFKYNIYYNNDMYEAIYNAIKDIDLGQELNSDQELNSNKISALNSRIMKSIKDISMFNNIGLQFLDNDSIKNKLGSDFSNKSAFTLDGQIYINTDKLNPDSLLHEYMHMYLGIIRYKHPDVYNNILNIFQNSLEINPHDTIFTHDIEELLVNKLSKRAENKLNEDESFNLDMLFEASNITNLILQLSGVNTNNNDNIQLKDLLTSKLSEISESDDIPDYVKISSYRRLDNYKERLKNESKLKVECF